MRMSRSVRIQQIPGFPHICKKPASRLPCDKSLQTHHTKWRSTKQEKSHQNAASFQPVDFFLFVWIWFRDTLSPIYSSTVLGMVFLSTPSLVLFFYVFKICIVVSVFPSQKPSKLYFSHTEIFVVVLITHKRTRGGGKRRKKKISERGREKVK